MASAHSDLKFSEVMGALNVKGLQKQPVRYEAKHIDQWSSPVTPKAGSITPFKEANEVRLILPKSALANKPTTKV